MKKQLLAITLLVSAVTIQAKTTDKEKVIIAVETLQQGVKKLAKTIEQKNVVEALKETKEVAQNKDTKDTVVKQKITAAVMKAKRLEKLFKDKSGTQQELSQNIDNLEKTKSDL